MSRILRGFRAGLWFIAAFLAERAEIARLSATNDGLSARVSELLADLAALGEQNDKLSSTIRVQEVSIEDMSKEIERNRKHREAEIALEVAKVAVANAKAKAIVEATLQQI